MSDEPSLDRLFDKLKDAMPDLDSDEQRLSLQIYRSLASGRPVTVEALARQTHLPSAKVDAILGSWPGVFRNDEAAIVGYWGLAIPRMSHEFEVEGVTLYTWCAWDSLFIPELLGKQARFASRCPATGREIRLTIGPEGVRSVSPPEIALSFLAPTAPFDDDVVTTFCHHIHFFASRAAAEAWVKERPGHIVLSLQEGLELARRTNRSRYRDLFAGAAGHGNAVAP